jgi:hypothetical protein
MIESSAQSTQIHNHPTTHNMPAINKPGLSLFQKKQKMSLSQTYFLAHTARGKLSKEAARGDHDLRMLVGHANLLDGLMLDLADAEREQESWFNQTVRDAAAAPQKADAKRVTWADSLPAVTEDDDSDSESEADEDDMVITTATAAHLASSATAIDLDSDEEEDDEIDAGLQLTRTPSRSSPPELSHGHDSESDSEDEEMPPSPPAPRMQFAQPAAAKKQESLRMEHEEALYEDGFFLPPRPQAIAAY